MLRLLDVLKAVRSGGEEDWDWDLADFLKGRACPGAYKVTLERFVSCVVGHRLYKKRLTACPCRDEQLHTASDEAFMLLLLENGWDRWIDIYDNGHNKPREEGSRKWRFVSAEPMLYTHGGIRFSEDDSRASNGWTNAGIQRYNELFRFVKEDRARHPNVFTTWVTEHAGEFQASGRSGPACHKAPTTAIASDLFSELGVGGDTAPVQRPSDVSLGDEFEDAVCD